MPTHGAGRHLRGRAYATSGRDVSKACWIQHPVPAVSCQVSSVAMRASRLVSLLLLLQTRGMMTAAELARELEVSVRTIHRDVEALAISGVPIYAERGPHGGIRLVEGYRTRLTGMTAEEADALFLSGIPGPAAELGLGTVVAAARLKVLAALPTELRGRATRLLERFHLDAAGWFQAGENVPHLADVAEAVWEGRQVRVDYQRGDKSVERTLHPLGIVLKGGVWYLVAATEGQVRTYRISRIATLQLLDEPAERPERFDLGAFWAESSAAYERDAPRLDVVVRVRPDRYWWLSDAAGQLAMESAEILDVPDREGWTHVRLRMEWPDEAGRRLAALGPSVEILEPVELRGRVARAARELLAHYGDDPVPPVHAEMH
jgi:predicted DNA-binding transcriptional regulator YafY